MSTRLHEKMEVKEVHHEGIDAILKGMGPSRIDEVSNKLMLPPVFVNTVDGRELQVTYKSSDESGVPFRKATFTQRGWASYAARTFRVDDPGDDDGLGKKKTTMSSRSILNLLLGSSLQTANKVIEEWHAREIETWRMVVRNANDEIRYIGTGIYELYLNSEFWADINEVVDFDKFVVQKALIDEDIFSIRITQREPLKIEGFTDVYLGIEAINSENGSGSHRGRFIIFDLKCTNGMFIDLGSFNVFKKAHRSWDREAVREEVKAAFRMLPELVGKAQEVLNLLHKTQLSEIQADTMLQNYKKQFGASDKFLAEVFEHWKAFEPRTTWGVISAITFKAQRFSLASRIQHERNAGEYIKSLLKQA